MRQKPSDQRTNTYRYDAFISYSHKADSDLAEALERQIEKFAKPWYRLHSAHVFRDETSLSASPHLWGTIVPELQHSAYLILLACSTSAGSRWVQREICYWITDGACEEPAKLEPAQIKTEKVERVLVVLTEGEIAWDDTNGDFDWTKTTAIPKSVLSGAFRGEPLWVDLRWARQTPREKLDRSNEALMHAVARLSSPIRQLDIESLIGNDYREHRRSMRLAKGAIASLVILLVLAMVSAGAFYWQWGVSAQRAKELTIADGYRLMELGTEQLNSGNPERANVSFISAEKTLEKVGHNPLMALHRRLAAELASLPCEKLFDTDHGRNISAMHVSDDGTRAVLLFTYNDVPIAQLQTSAAVEVWDVATHRKIISHSPLSPIGKQVPGGEVLAVIPPCDLLIRSHSKSGQVLERFSLADGSRVPHVAKLSAEAVQRQAELARLPLTVSFTGNTLHFQPRHAGRPMFFSGFFQLNPENGNDRMYADPFGEKPDLVKAESLDGCRLLVGTYEGTLGLFEARYGRQLRRGRIAGVRSIKYIGDTRNALAVDEHGSVWRISEDHPSVLRGLLPFVKVNQDFGGLALSSDGSVLAGYSKMELFAYDVPGRRLLGRRPLEKHQGEAVAFGLNDKHHQVIVAFADGQAFSMQYGTSEQDASIRTFQLHAMQNSSKPFSLVACLDLEDQSLRSAVMQKDTDCITLRAIRLSTLEAATPARTVPVEGVERLTAMVRYGPDILLFGVGGDSEEAFLLRVPLNSSQHTSKKRLFERAAETSGPDTVWRLKTVDRLLSASPGSRLFARAGFDTIPVFPANEKGTSWLRKAIAIVDIQDEANVLTGAVTSDGFGAAILCVRNDHRDLLYRAPLPTSSWPDAACITADGRTAAIATATDGIMLIDLNLLAKAPLQ